MIMKLPEKGFINPKAEIVGNTLKIKRRSAFENCNVFGDLVYLLRYTCNDSKRCIYCGTELDDSNRSLDHIYPLSTGGVTIVDNLNPCCKSCNSDKGNMTHEEYLYYLSLSPEGRETFGLKEVGNRRKRILRTKGFNLPDEWIIWIDPEEIKAKRPLDYVRDGTYNFIEKIYNRYHNFTKPIIADKEFNLISGFNTYLFAQIKNSLKYQLYGLKMFYWLMDTKFRILKICLDKKDRFFI